MTLSIYAPTDWLEDSKIQMIENTKGRNQLKSKMNILSWDKTPEQLMIYFKNYKDKILMNTILTAPEKLAIFRQIVDMKA